jgi:hypothetical protein
MSELEIVSGSTIHKAVGYEGSAPLEVRKSDELTKRWVSLKSLKARDAQAIKILEKVEASPAVVYKELFFISRNQISKLTALLLLSEEANTKC